MLAESEKKFNNKHNELEKMLDIKLGRINSDIRNVDNGFHARFDELISKLPSNKENSGSQSQNYRKYGIGYQPMSLAHKAPNNYPHNSNDKNVLLILNLNTTMKIKLT